MTFRFLSWLHSVVSNGFCWQKYFVFFYMKSVGNKLNDIRAVLDSSRRCTCTLLLFFWLYLSSQLHIHTNTTSIWNDTNTHARPLSKKRTKIHVINIYANFKVEIFSFFCYIIFLRSYSYHLTSLMFALLPFCQVRFVKSVLSKTCIHCDISEQFQFYKNICCTFNFRSTFLACDSIVSSPSFKR